MIREILPHPLSVHSYLLRVRGGQDLYMESGVLDHLNVAPLNEDTHKPSQLHYGTSINNMRGAGAELGALVVEEISDGLLNGENMDEGESLAVGCEQKLGEITASTDGGDTETFFSSPPAFCPDLRNEKRTQVLLPPSKWSGKLRLMVQGLYGTTRTDFAMDPTLEELGPLTFGSVTLGWTYSGGSALFSAEDYEYFLMEVRSSGLWARTLRPSLAGKKLRTYLIDNPDLPAARKTRYETYLLSTLSIPSNTEWIQITSDSGDAYDFGTPWYYGWSWNMDGTIARAVTIQNKPGTTNVWQSTLFKLTVTEVDSTKSLEEGRLSATFTTEEATQDFTFRANEDLIWYPNDLGAGMRIFVSQEDAFDAPTQIESDVPMYCVYDYQNDTHHVVRFKRELFGSGVGGLGGTASSDGRSADPLCGDSACDYYSEVDTAYEIGFYVEDKENDFAAYAISGENVIIRGNEANVGALDGPEDTSPFSPVTTSTLEDQCHGLFGASEIHHGEPLEYTSSGGDITLEGDLETESMLVVPINDCDSIYLGRRDIFLASTNVVSSHTLDGSVVRASINVYKNSTEIYENGEDLRIHVGWDAGGGGTGGGPGGSARNNVRNAANFDGLLNEVNASGDWKHVDIRYFLNGEFVEIHSQSHVTNANLAGGLFFPQCVTTATGIGFNTVPDDWTTDTFGTAGYEFDPVLFPEPETMSPVTSLSTANFGDYKARKDLDLEDTVTEGGYDFENISGFGRISFVGFA